MLYQSLFVCMGTLAVFFVAIPLLMDVDLIHDIILAAMILVASHLIVCSVVYRFDRSRRNPLRITMDEILHRYPEYKQPRKRHAKEYHRN